ncbi:Cell death regulator Aven [Merluccius polli]|uniref:Cell death regulator Aven n=1 Tax=Merluccius polli TaxID=89951 RepID=A0AA47N374_MERPO|nr:Cell death regulator Aven [Merluccius polli]
MSAVLLEAPPPGDGSQRPQRPLLLMSLADDLLQFKPSIRMGKKVPIEHRVKATDYLSIVADHVHPFMTTVYPSSDGYFQQDNAPCHKARIISDWFLEHDNEFTVLKWPPQSSDLNPIEHLWDVVEREIRIMDVQPTNLQQLRDAIMSIWTKLSEECFQYLVESVPRRIKAVLKAKGGDSFTQFRFSEEKDWEMDSVASSQMSAVRLDLVALAQCLQALPLHQRLNLEAELVQVSTPLELPAATIPPKQDPILLTPPISTTKDTGPRLALAGSPLVATPPQVAPALANLSPVDDADEELDRLLGLDKPGPDATLSQPADTYVVPQEVAPEEVPERVEPALPTRTEPAKQEVTEEDLEDWLDSMIS